MPILIDAWNFIRDEDSNIEDTDRDSLDSARTLVSYLERFQASHNDPVILVFDSTNEFLGMQYTNSPKLKIVPAKNADDYIKKYIDKTPEPQRKNIRVVSSDKEVFYYAKSSYAIPVRCRDFWAKLRGG